MNEPVVPAGEPTPPSTLKVGDKEYTPEQIEQLEKSVAEKEEQYKNLQSDYSKKAEKAKLYDELQNKADEVIKGDRSASEMTPQELEDLQYMQKLGFITPAKLKEVVEKVKEETTKEVEEKLTKKELREKTEKEIESLASQHSFIDKEELKKYMSDRAQGGTVLTADEAATLLYKDKFLASGVKPNELPGVVNGKKQAVEEPKAKILPLGSREMSERIAERLNKVD